MANDVFKLDQVSNSCGVKLVASLDTTHSFLTLDDTLKELSVQLTDKSVYGFFDDSYLVFNVGSH